MTKTSSGTKITPEELAENPRLQEIHTALKTLIDLCNITPKANIICTISMAGESNDSDDKIISVYNGDTLGQVNQLHQLVENSPQFASDLRLLLSYIVRTQINNEGTTGNDLADQLFASLDKSDKGKGLGK